MLASLRPLTSPVMYYQPSQQITISRKSSSEFDDPTFRFRGYTEVRFGSCLVLFPSLVETLIVYKRCKEAVQCGSEGQIWTANRHSTTSGDQTSL